MSAVDANFPSSLPGILCVAEWSGALLAVSGALVMSMCRQWSWYAWPLWILSNVLLIVPTAQGEHWGLVAMQSAFLVVNVNGLLRYRRSSPRPPVCRRTRGGRGDVKQS